MAALFPRLEPTDAPRGWRGPAILFAVAMLVAAAASLFNERPGELMPDEFFYLAHAMAIGEQGQFAMAHPDLSQPPADAISMPGYPYFLYAVLSLDGAAYTDALCAHREVRNSHNVCEARFTLLFAVQTALMGLALFAAAMIARRITGRLLPAGVTAVFAGASGLPGYYAGLILTESLYIPLAALALWAFVEGVTARSWRWLAAAGFLLALAALTRASLHYVFFFMAVLAALWLFFGAQDRRAGLRRAALLAGALVIGYAVAAGPWIARNAAVTGKPAMVTGYSALVLSTRAAYNEMTWSEYAAGWVYWLPDFGDNLAADLFGEDRIERLRFEGENAFYPDGFAAIRSEASEAVGIPFGAPDPENRLTGYILDNHILNQPAKHLAVSALLSWRGLFIGKYFGLVGLIAILLVLLTPPFRAVRGPFLLALLPPVFLLGLQGVISLNVPRYNLFMLVPMALAVALVLAALRQAIGARSAAARSGGFMTASAPVDATRLRFVISAGRTATVFLARYLDQVAPANIEAVHEPESSRRVFMLWNASRAGVPGAEGLARALFRRARRKVLRRLKATDALRIELNCFLAPLAPVLHETVRPLAVAHVVRHPYDWIVSMGNFRAAGWRRPIIHLVPFARIVHDEARAGWRRMSEIEKLAWRWRAAVESVLACEATADRYVLVRYEDMFAPDAAAPGGALHRVAETLFAERAGEIPLTAARERQRENAAPEGDIPDWRAWSEADRAAVNRICGALMERLGYDRRD